MALGTRVRHLTTETDPDVIEAGWFVMDHDTYTQARKVAAADMPGSGGGGGPLPDGIVLDDGTTPFTAPQVGVDATAGNHLATKGQLDTIAGSAETALAAAEAAVAAATSAARLPLLLKAAADLVAGAYTLKLTDFTSLLICDFGAAVSFNLPQDFNTITVPGSGGPTAAVLDIINRSAGAITFVPTGTATAYSTSGALTLAQNKSCILYVGSDNVYYIRMT